jgi:hypothetical protein
MFFVVISYIYHVKESVYSDWLRAGRPMDRTSNPGRVKNFPHVILTGCGAHPGSFLMGTGGKAAWV